MTNLILCGLPCSGKSTLGPYIAKARGATFIDLDICMLHDTPKRTLRELYIEVGEERFRELECAALTQLLHEKNAVIALGGGTLENAHAQNLLPSLGITLYLETSLEKAWERLKVRGIPTALYPSSAAFHETAKRRVSIFEHVADFILNLDSYNLPSDVWEITLLALSLPSQRGESHMEKRLGL